ncbi:glycosyltransferase family 1 protein [Modestobacter altitudinis]|uniref:glycosyltransferase family 1 protein n=1 Tax=Modestobacter altitudinis TaxID=2213158 RepID=UPI00110D0A12|nr:glycosyltransferase family 1 protein [Modestobacter altitudinis]
MSRGPHQRPAAGYVGVIDERLDLDLVADLAASLPHWTIRMVGPVTKIDPAHLPQADTLEYPGLVAYHELPEVMAGLDVALMPFALNEATRSISPTKTEHSVHHHEVRRDACIQCCWLPTSGGWPLTRLVEAVMNVVDELPTSDRARACPRSRTRPSTVPSPSPLRCRCRTTSVHQRGSA